MTWITRVGAVLVAAGLAASGVAGCSAGDEPAAPGAATTADAADAAGDDSRCTSVEAPMQEIRTAAPGEPRMAIPAPPGWDRSTMFDGELVRYMLVNRSLTADEFAPNVGVTLESAPGVVSPQTVFDQQRAALVNPGGATDLVTTPAELCGHPAEIVDYTGAPVGTTPARPITVLLSALSSGGRTYAVAVTIQTLDPQNPTYQQDKKTILDGFRFVASGGNPN